VVSKKLNLLKGNTMDNTCEIDGKVCTVDEISNCVVHGVTYVAVEDTYACDGCIAEHDRNLCESLLAHSNCSDESIIWIKKEEPVVKATEVITFTKEQVNYLSEVFGIDATEEVLKVSDGFVKNSGMVWWKYQFGPEHVKASEHWDNIKACPDVYSVKEPTYKVVYE
jgi:hypothetical protein